MGNEVEIGKVSVHFFSISSTNEFANSLLAKSEPIAGTVISADYQTSGKGQYDKSWQSAPKMNLLLSVVLFPDFLRAQYNFLLNIMAAQSVIDLIEKLSPEPRCQIKWPNDILVKGKKIAGILIKNNIQGNAIKSSVCGFGINVNQQTFDCDSMGVKPTSLYLTLKKEFELPALFSSFIYSLNENYRLLKEDRNTLLAKANGYLFGSKEFVVIKNIRTGQSMEVKVMELDAHGKVRVFWNNQFRWIDICNWKIAMG